MCATPYLCQSKILLILQQHPKTKALKSISADNDMRDPLVIGSNLSSPLLHTQTRAERSAGRSAWPGTGRSAWPRCRGCDRRRREGVHDGRWEAAAARHRGGGIKDAARSRPREGTEEPHAGREPSKVPNPLIQWPHGQKLK